MGKPLSKKEVQNIKLLLNKGLDVADICEVTGRSRRTIERIKKGERDYLLEPKKELPKENPKAEDKHELAKAYNLIWNALCIIEKLGGGKNEWLPNGAAELQRAFTMSKLLWVNR